jgi:hypothetical protein
MVVHGEMVDVSPSGFRIRYHGAPITAGSTAEVTYPFGEVQARVVWVCPVGGWCDAGFQILQKR